MLFYKVDEQGSYSDLVLLDAHPTLDEVDDKGNLLIDPLYVSTPIPNNLYFGKDIKPKWNFEEQKWIEGATQEEIDELTKPQPQEPTVEERLAQTEELLQTVTMAFTEYVFMQDTSDDS